MKWNNLEASSRKYVYRNDNAVWYGINKFLPRTAYVIDKWSGY